MGLFRRDDPAPAPWTEEGQKRIKEEENEESESPAVKKSKTVYKISKEWEELMREDKVSANLWEQVKSKGAANKKELTDYVEEIFCCIICQDIVFKPVTTPCSHNICLECLERSF